VTGRACFSWSWGPVRSRSKTRLTELPARPGPFLQDGRLIAGTTAQLHPAQIIIYSMGHLDGCAVTQMSRKIRYARLQGAGIQVPIYA